MRRTKPSASRLIPLIAVGLLISLVGCDVGYDYGPEWDGQLYVGGGYGPGYDRDHRDHAFRDDGGRHPIGEASDRGRASMGARGGGAGRGSSGGGGGGRR
jgi:hypothetical protein